ncbi:hypothetical protein DW817_01220 [Acidaminococcus sp. AM33-14BH]|nr:hypothetical protein DW817_01220 [Acidaminococcus sp. AM33-14BH]
MEIVSLKSYQEETLDKELVAILMEISRTAASVARNVVRLRIQSKSKGGNQNERCVAERCHCGNKDMRRIFS